MRGIPARSGPPVSHNRTIVPHFSGKSKHFSEFSFSLAQGFRKSWQRDKKKAGDGIAFHARSMLNERRMSRNAAVLYFFTRYVKQAGARRKPSAVPWRGKPRGHDIQLPGPGSVLRNVGKNRKLANTPGAFLRHLLYAFPGLLSRCPMECFLQNGRIPAKTYK